MTAQFGDMYTYKQKSYTVIATSDAFPFRPKEYGLEPHCSCTACYRGYWCEYAIIDDQLVLQNLYLFNRDGAYPPINGVEVEPQEFIEHDCSTSNGRNQIIKLPKLFGHRIYKNVNLPILYSGKILLGNGFLHEFYVHMGFQRGWAYQELIELCFEEGILVESYDLSHIAKEKRQSLEQQNVNLRYPDDTDIPQFVEDSFSLGYPEKAWWLKE